MFNQINQADGGMSTPPLILALDAWYDTWYDTWYDI